MSGQNWSLPWFRTEADRDAGYREWLAAGNVMYDGMLCTVARSGPAVDLFRWDESERCWVQVS